MRYPFYVIAACLLLPLSLFGDETKIPPNQLEFFEKQIRPILVQHCYECHSVDADEVGGNLYLDSREGSLTGGESGPAVVPADLRASLLIDALEYGSFEMPPDAPLPDEVIAKFKRWIRMGAPDPRDARMPHQDSDTDAEDQSSEPLWSLQPIPDSTLVPEVEDPQWPRSEIDRFVQSEREKQGLHPVGDAMPESFLRRLSFDLVGLSPSAEHLAQIQQDDSVQTIESIVDDLLDSPRFGERWGRHWLDVARFAESAGSSRDVLMPYAWKYRDYVIDAINDDLPYTRFITEQIAGDLLDAPTKAERERLTVATGLLAVGQKSLNGGNLALDIADDQIDVVGKAVLGLTVSCARCHDHKFDPIPTRDYYSLAGIFLSTETLYGGGTKRPKTSAEKVGLYLAVGDEVDVSIKALDDLAKELAQLNKKKKTLTNRNAVLLKKLPRDWQEQEQALAERLKVKTDEQAKEARKNDGGLQLRIDQYRKGVAALKQLQSEIKAVESRQSEIPAIDFAVGVRDSKKLADTKIRIRGESNDQGEVAPRGFLECVGLDTSSILEESGLGQIDGDQSGRLQLAAWLTDTKNPLPARVAANRIWLHLFGRGLVETADNFGSNGVKPSHPKLLDYLAREFIQLGWSTKKLIREIVLSRTYRLSTVFDEQDFAIDPANRFYWRNDLRRLEAEAIRDAMLSASGQLDLDRPPFGSTVARIGEGEVGRGINTDLLEEPFPYRSVYLPVIRGILPESLKLFDFPDPSNPQTVRDATNVPSQSLYFMNSPFVVEQAELAAKEILAKHETRSDRIAAAYMAILGRQPGEEEAQRIALFLDGDQTAVEPGEQEPLLAWTTVIQSLFASAEFRYLN